MGRGELARFRFARHYANKLSDLNARYTSGGQEAGLALAEFDRDWDQIRAAQGWAAAHDERLNAGDIARLCSDFSLTAPILLDLRQPAQERIVWTELALSVVRALGERELEAAHLNHLGSSYLHLGSHEEAAQHFGSAIRVVDEMPDGHEAAKRYQGKAHNNLAILLKRQGEFQAAAAHCREALQLARQTGDRRDELNALANLGDIAHLQQDREQALRYYRQAWDVARQIQDARSEGSILGSIGNVYLKEGYGDRRWLADALRHYAESLARYQAIDDRRGQMRARGMLGEVHRIQGQYAPALEQYTQALRIAREANDLYNLALILFNLALLHVGRQQVTEARDAAAEAVRYFEAMGMDDMIRRLKEYVPGL